ncbi:MAG: YegS/Rv2252/BmrU family lipid kinase [Lachnospiraceae bacterium]|nr:YegS/Rv2252/BmrU family lipid kinase [Lachnospiraceae bacterium]
MYYIIVNPSSKSGRGIRIWQKLKPVFQERNIPYKLMLSTHIGHVAEFTREITKTDENVNIIVLGGDGTINEALQGIRDFSKVSIGYIPTGSSNDLARDMKLGKDPMKILDTILSGKVSRMVDIGTLTYGSRGEATAKHLNKDVKEDIQDKRYFVVSSGIGFDAAVCEEALSSNIKDLLNKLKLGKLTYLGIALKQLIAAKPVTCDMYLDDKEHVHADRFLFIASMIHKYEGGGFKFCPDADSSDGQLDLCFVGNIPKPLILVALPTAFFGKHYIFPHILHYSAQKVEIKTSVPLWVHTDGEVYFKSDHIYLSCEKQKLKFLA